MSLVNSRVSNDVLARSFQNRATLPLGTAASNPQREGSMIFDSRLDKLYISNGTQWLEVITSSGGNLTCIQDTDGDTSVCTDTTPETDSDTIFFTTAGAERARITPTGVLSVGTATPTAGKIAHFEGDIKVTGVVDPTATVYEEQTVSPVTPATGIGVVWVKDDVPTVLVFTDSSGAEHDITGPGVTDTLAEVLANGNVTGGTDISVTSGDGIVTATGSGGGSGGALPLSTGAGDGVGDGGLLSLTSDIFYR